MGRRSRRRPRSPAWRSRVSPRSACSRTTPMNERYPGYDVLRKRDTPSWNDITRRVIEARLNVPREPRFFDAAEWRTLEAVCDQIMPQPAHREKIPLPAYV